MEHHFVVNLLLLMTGSTALVALCHRLGLSSIVGYLASGLLFGPHVLHILTDSDVIHWLAETGVVLLMFTIGLEFSIPRLLASRRLVLGLGGAQILSLTLLFALLLTTTGVNLPLAVVLGGAFAMSSTAIVLKQLNEQGESRAAHTRIATGILLFQDIAAIPFLVLLPLIGTETNALPVTLLATFLKAVAVFLALAVVGRRLLPGLLHWVADTHSLEIFMLSVIALALSAASISMLAGLSATLGSFMAGMLLGETHFRHQVEADIRPFRDLMLGIFFISIGMQFDPHVLLQAPALILLAVIALTAVKGVVMLVIIRLFGYEPPVAARSAIILAQGGEFGLLLVSQVLAFGLAEDAGLQPLLAALIISMLLAPLLVRFNLPLSRLLVKHTSHNIHASEPVNLQDESNDYSDHVIICGYRRLGQGVARILNEKDIETLAIDNDPKLVRELRSSGAQVVYGDAANATLLELAQINHARAVAITFEDKDKARLIISQVQRLNPGLPVLVHSRHSWEDTESLTENVSIFDDTLESSLMFARQLLIMSGVESSVADRAANSVRARDYSEFQAVQD
ncbi:MAG TPA: potassium transporter [Thiolapillus brandeum]|uniref:Potassium transporter n=1 Tax=Thiolapillus brandeum TaxID=1076588 RepID=A0A831WFG8_9GAMM|nr:potassium transporter [Thiolapillus brandeum]